MKNVVIVDDHPAICLAVKSVLESSGKYKVVADCDNGQSAIETMRENRVDLMVVDLNIPRIGGLDLIKRLKTQQPDTKMLVLSAHDESVYASRSMQAGADGYVSKTRDLGSVVSAADVVMAGYSFFPRGVVAGIKMEDGKTQDTRINKLSDRELSVLQHLVQGLSNKDIAERLFISNKTVSTYKVNIFEKLGISNVVELTDFARSNNLV
ncbi:response regulator transcription factor [uncultured Aquitalea sp.]|uniref:response regulator transcription factor n=1 Tax=uncultured Aquitalea sp. TaxID=540272 RepID=UPI0025D61BCE|nr:response regulator transcription factor [uncultured Aquitalea sp.]